MFKIKCYKNPHLLRRTFRPFVHSKRFLNDPLSPILLSPQTHKVKPSHNGHNMHISFVTGNSSNSSSHILAEILTFQFAFCSLESTEYRFGHMTGHFHSYLKPSSSPKWNGFCCFKAFLSYFCNKLRMV